MRNLLLITLLLLFTQEILAQSMILQSTTSTLNVGDLDVPGDKITVEALIYVPAGGGGVNVVSKHTHTGNVNYLLRPVTFELTTYVSGNSGPTKFLQMFNPFHLLPNQWYHIAGTYDGQAVRYYVNGCLVIQTPWTGNLYQNDLITSIGNQSSCLCESYMGMIDEVRIWNVCRSQTDIAANMLSLPNPTTQTGLQAYYKFNGNYVNEQGDNRWNGTASGPIAFSQDEAHIEGFSISSVQTQNADCPKSKSGSITIAATRNDAQFAVDGGLFQADNTFKNLLPGQHVVYARTPEGCVLDSTVFVGDNHTYQQENITTSICQGQSLFGYATAGNYVDTLSSVAACDTIRTLHLSVIPVQRLTKQVTVCQGQSYALPSGTTVNAPGIYQDTLHYRGGCDSVISTVEIKLLTPTSIQKNIVLCPGETYTLPWGSIVNAAGSYKDTLHSSAGCDSLRRDYIVSYRSATTTSLSKVICNGDTYTLPWGSLVTVAGTYRDTLRYSAGCDSIIRSVTVSVQEKHLQSTAATICQGASYTLPWGTIVKTSGMYRDTLRFQTGCDSLIREVLLTVRTVTIETNSVAICSGHSYTLPWGPVATATGIYSDTLRYRDGCDSLIKEIRLNVTAPAYISQRISICANESYTLPSGVTVSQSGIYRDTVKTRNGCDSLIRQVTLQVNDLPRIQLTKSNDIGCMLGTAKLNATGGATYRWTPQSGLTNAFINNPTASPSVTTTYKVTIESSEGCKAEDSLEVKVIQGDPQNGYLVPNSFTPNNDGKNDCFGVPYWGAVTNFNFSVYNRYGELVFHTADVSRCWDGSTRGKPQQPGVFVYWIKASTNCGPVVRKGTVTLLR